MRKKTLMNIIRFGLIFLALAFFVFPLVWMVSTSLKTEADAFRYPPVFLSKPTLNNYRSVLQSDFPKSVLNSITICLSTVAISILLGTPAAYALSRYNFKHKKDFAMWILSTRMAPPIVVIIPFFLLINKLHMFDRLESLIIIYLGFNLPLVVLIMRSFFEDIPIEFDEAGMVDGLSYPGIFWYIILPICREGLVATWLLSFLLTWNEFLFASLLLNQENWTIPVVMASFEGIGQTQGYVAELLLSSATVIVTLPLINLVLILK